MWPGNSLNRPSPDNEGTLMTTDSNWLFKDYDVIVCGSGTSGSVVARRLSDLPHVRVLLLEAGESDQRPSITDPARWTQNLGTDVDWSFMAQPGAEIAGRSLFMSAGKVIGGSSSINGMIWARGHRRDWDHYAAVTGDSGWSYAAVSEIYRSVEDWTGPTDKRRGSGGVLKINPSDNPHPVAEALVEAAGTIGIPTFVSPNGAMMEAEQGAALSDVRLDRGRRLSIFDSYVGPVLDRGNLTVVTGVTLRRVLFDGNRATGVEIEANNAVHRLRAGSQVVLSTGAINTPKILMLSGVGDRETLACHGISTVVHLPGVGMGLQDHANFPIVWSFPQKIEPHGSGSEAIIYADSGLADAGPDILICQAEFPLCDPELARRGAPEHGWTLVAGLAQPKSRGRVLLASDKPQDAPIVLLNTLTHPDDLQVALAITQLGRRIGGAKPFVELGCREAVSADALNLTDEEFVRRSALPFWHQSCTARMGQDDESVVGADLKVHGTKNLTIADASVLPRIPTGNSMAPCVVIGERAGAILGRDLS